MPLTPLTVDSSSPQSAQIDAINKTIAGINTTVAQNPATTIPVSSLTTSAVPAKVTQPAPATQMAGLQGTIQAGQDAYTQNLANNTANAQVGMTTSYDALLKSLVGTQGQTALTANAYAGTVDPAEAALKDINNQILSEQVSARHQIEALNANPQGMSTGQLQANQDNINRQSLSKQADLSVIQLAKQGQYDSAKQIADRAVAAKMEQQKNQNDILQFMYTENKDLFTKAEQRSFETAQADRNRKLDMQTYQEKAKYDQLIKQNDPAYQLDLKLKRLQIASAGAKSTSAPTITKINGVDMQWNPATGQWVKPAAPGGQNMAQTDAAQAKIDAIKGIQASPGISSRVGTSFLSRIPQGGGLLGNIGGGLATLVKGVATLGTGTYGDVTSQVGGSGQQFSGSVHNLTQGLTLQNLIDAKANGATFGALSEGELGLLAASATKLNDWEIKDSKGAGTGVWNIDEKSFNTELNRIKTLTQKAIDESSGSASVNGYLDSVTNILQSQSPYGAYITQ